jgi:hypothetical protein
MPGNSMYSLTLVSAWHWIWGTVLALVGILIMFNIQDTYFQSDGAPAELTTNAVIVGIAALVFGIALIAVGFGIWRVFPWAWWASTVTGVLVIVADLVNFGRLAALLSLESSDQFSERVAQWPILMWSEQLTFLGTHKNELLLVSWPILVHLLVMLPVVLFMLSPQVREAFGIAAVHSAYPSAPFEPTRVRAPVREARSSVDDTAIRGPDVASGPSLGYLIVQTGANAGRSYELGAQTRIGRSRRSNDIALDDQSVSREHALIRLENGRFVLSDRGSRNRSYVITSSGEQEVVGRHVLADGDRLRIGETTLVFRDARP